MISLLGLKFTHVQGCDGWAMIPAFNDPPTPTHQPTENQPTKQLTTGCKTCQSCSTCILRAYLGDQCGVQRSTLRSGATRVPLNQKTTVVVGKPISYRRYPHSCKLYSVVGNSAWQLPHTVLAASTFLIDSAAMERCSQSIT